MASVMGNSFKGELLKGAIDCVNDAFKGALMATAFTFNIDTHDGWAQVSASELGAGNGYTAGGQAMTGGAVAVDDANDRADATWNDLSWTASGGSIGPSPGLVIFDDTHLSDANAGFVDFGADQTATDGGTFQVTNPTVRLA